MYDSLNVRATRPPYVARTVPNRKAGPHWDWPVRSMIYLKVLDRPLDLCLQWRGEGHAAREAGQGESPKCSEFRTQNFELRVAPVALHERFFTNNV